MKRLNAALASLLLGLPQISLLEEIITGNAQIPDAIVINFDGVPTVENGTGPLKAYNPYGIDIEVSGTPVPGLFTNPATHGFGSNGNWTGGAFVAMASTPPEWSYQVLEDTKNEESQKWGWLVSTKSWEFQVDSIGLYWS